MPDQDIGTLYVLANRDQSLAKIGLTRDGAPDARASDYERAHGIRWYVYWSAVTCNVAAAEAAAHRELDICRFALVPGAREVFHVTPAKAKRVAERYVVPPSSAAKPSDARSAELESYGEALISAISPVLVRIATSNLRRHRYGPRLFACWSVLSRLFSWWTASRRHRTLW
jgi:hypothetical protein